MRGFELAEFVAEVIALVIPEKSEPMPLVEPAAFARPEATFVILDSAEVASPEVAALATLEAASVILDITELAPPEVAALAILEATSVRLDRPGSELLLLLLLDVALDILFVRLDVRLSKNDP